MKITKSQLRKLIKEALTPFQEFDSLIDDAMIQLESNIMSLEKVKLDFEDGDPESAIRNYIRIRSELKELEETIAKIHKLTSPKAAATTTVGLAEGNKK